MRMEETTTGSVTDSAGTKPSATPSWLVRDESEGITKGEPSYNYLLNILSSQKSVRRDWLNCNQKRPKRNERRLSSVTYVTKLVKNTMPRTYVILRQEIGIWKDRVKSMIYRSMHSTQLGKQDEQSRIAVATTKRKLNLVDTARDMAVTILKPNIAQSPRIRKQSSSSSSDVE